MKRRVKRKAKKREGFNFCSWGEVFPSSLQLAMNKEAQSPDCHWLSFCNCKGITLGWSRYEDGRVKGGKHLDDMMVPLILLCLESALLLVLKLSEVINFLIDKQA